MLWLTDLVLLRKGQRTQWLHRGGEADVSQLCMPSEGSDCAETFVSHVVGAKERPRRVSRLTYVWLDDGAWAGSLERRWGAQVAGRHGNGERHGATSERALARETTVVSGCWNGPVEWAEVPDSSAAGSRAWFQLSGFSAVECSDPEVRRHTTSPKCSFWSVHHNLVSAALPPAPHLLTAWTRRDEGPDAPSCRQTSASLICPDSRWLHATAAAPGHLGRSSPGSPSGAS